jgi:hypothetical protein
MTKLHSALSIAAAVAASVFALHAPVASAAANGVPGVETNVGKNANDGGVPGVEMNVGRDGDQKNVDRTTTTREMGAAGDTQRTVASTTRPRRADRN